MDPVKYEELLSHIELKLAQELVSQRCEISIPKKDAIIADVFERIERITQFDVMKFEREKLESQSFAKLYAIDVMIHDIVENLKVARRKPNADLVVKRRLAGESYERISQTYAKTNANQVVAIFRAEYLRQCFNNDPGLKSELSIYRDYEKVLYCLNKLDNRSSEVLVRQFGEEVFELLVAYANDSRVAQGQGKTIRGLRSHFLALLDAGRSLRDVYDQNPRVQIGEDEKYPQPIVKKIVDNRLSTIGQRVKRA